MQYLVLMLICLAVAAFGSLIGAGGGFLLMPIFLILYQGKTFDGQVMGPRELTFISLFAVLVNGLAATFNYARMKRVDYRTGAILAVCTIPTAVVARRLLAGLRGDQFAPIFGIVLLAIGAFIIWRVRKKGDAALQKAEPKPRWTRRTLVDASGRKYEYAFDLRVGVCASLAEGFVASFFGIGGGILHVPVMTQLLHFPAHIASATSILILSVSAMAGVLSDVISKGGDVPMKLALVAGLGAFVGAQVGTRLSKKVSGERILYLLAVALIVAGGKLLAGPLLPKGRNSTPAQGTPVVRESIPREQ